MKGRIHKKIIEIISNSGRNGITESELVAQFREQFGNVSKRDIVIRVGKLLYDGVVEIEEVDHTKVIKLRGNTEKLENFTETEKVGKSNQIVHVTTPSYHYKVQDVEEYIGEAEDIEDAKQILQAGENLLLSGDRGIGKSLLAANIAKEWNIPRYSFNCSHGLNESDLVGYYINFSTFVDGIITQAVKTACNGEDAMLVIEEINAINPGVSLMLHSLLDFQRQLEIKPTGEVLHLNGTGKLYIVATANIGYEGLFTLNRALHSRFIEKKLRFPSDSILSKILKKNGIESAHERNTIIGIVKAMKQSYEKGELDDYPTIREMKQYSVIRRFKDVRDAIQLIFFDKFVKSKVSEDVVKNIVKSIVPGF